MGAEASLSGGVSRLVDFGGALRRAGLPVGTGRVMAFCEAAALVDEEDLYWTGRATLVSRHDQIPIYDRVFGMFFAGQVPAATARERQMPRLVLTAVDAGKAGEIEVAGAPEAALASPDEVLRNKSFARCTPEELAQLSQAHLADPVRDAAPAVAAAPAGARRGAGPAADAAARHAHRGRAHGARVAVAASAAAAAGAAAGRVRARWRRSPGRWRSSPTRPCAAASGWRRSASGRG